MTIIDVKLEKFFKDTVANRPQRKNEETLTSFNRSIFWYDRDEIHRQAENAAHIDHDERITYEDHRKAIEIAVNYFRKDTQLDIAMCILTDRHFAPYRNKAFAGNGNFNTDYSFLVKKIAMLFNPHSSNVRRTNIPARIAEFTKPTLVQINHISGDVSAIKVASNKLTLNEWAIKYNEGANESTSYMVAGLKIG